MARETHDCDQCQHWSEGFLSDGGDHQLVTAGECRRTLKGVVIPGCGPMGDYTVVCRLGRRPRFTAPRSESDISWGWRRRCSDFLPVPEAE